MPPQCNLYIEELDLLLENHIREKVIVRQPIHSYELSCCQWNFHVAVPTPTWRHVSILNITLNIRQLDISTANYVCRCRPENRRNKVVNMQALDISFRLHMSVMQALNVHLFSDTWCMHACWNDSRANVAIFSLTACVKYGGRKI